MMMTMSVTRQCFTTHQTCKTNYQDQNEIKTKNEKRKTKNDSGATRFSFFLNLVTGIKVENGLMA